MRRAGYSEQATAGIIGNLMFESGGYPDDIKTNAVEYKSGEGIGDGAVVVRAQNAFSAVSQIAW